MLIAIVDIIDFLLTIVTWVIIGQVILSWLFVFTAPGYVIASAYYAALFGLACMACPPSAPGRWIAF